MVHAALLLLMLEGRHNDGPRFTISLKRSTQNLQLSTSWAGRLSHLWGTPHCGISGAGLRNMVRGATSRVDLETWAADWVARSRPLTSISPVCRPERSGKPICLAAAEDASAQRTARPGPSKVARMPSPE